MIKAVFFDLDGTLLPMDENTFAMGYMVMLHEKVKRLGYDDRNKMIKTIYMGAEVMKQNDGSMTNYDAFWKYFATVYGEKSLEDIPVFNEFYGNEFKASKQFCEDNPLAKPIVEKARELTGHAILSTNPIFPETATHVRLSFLGLTFDDFDYVTYYENSYYCKPNPKYFTDLLERFNLKPEEVILFGNDTYEDAECALMAGIKCYLVGNYIIRNPKATHEFPEIKMEDVIPTMEKEVAQHAND